MSMAILAKNTISPVAVTAITLAAISNTIFKYFVAMFFGTRKLWIYNWGHIRNDDHYGLYLQFLLFINPVDIFLKIREINLNSANFKIYWVTIIGLFYGEIISNISII